MRFENVERVWINVADAEINVEESEGRAVEVQVSPENRLTISKDGNLLNITVPLGQKFKNLLKKDNGSTRVSLKVPKSVKVEIAVKRGKVDAEDVRISKLLLGEGEAELSRCTVETINVATAVIRGSVRVNGDMNIVTAAGIIDLSITELEGDVNLMAATGSIKLTLPGDADARVVLNDGKGLIPGNIILKGINPEDPVLGTGERKIIVNVAAGNVVISTEGGEDDI
ncbi:hypothetical protein, conserved [Thermococcus onnurineus NA1]|uniref:Uncharacterized protein n=1 Tax=Thermococcus onnurineus (strain NA1) TaxID=523850 RepID=B6YUT2_THEON|nr:DUF4097 family beta strand repeat-containing protein [Thermococcus onnurineus]ACJ16118.1 hypothetical protein, conserved [Thermococcus onnurineus NA1]